MPQTPTPDNDWARTAVARLLIRALLTISSEFALLAKQVRR